MQSKTKQGREGSQAQGGGECRILGAASEEVGRGQRLEEARRVGDWFEVHREGGAHWSGRSLQD
jgi:hypothetical protein